MKTYPNGATKAVTFSYDDGVEQDIRLTEIFNKYSLKATFNLNYGLMDESSNWEQNGTTIRRLYRKEDMSIYDNFEVAVHGLKHKS